MKPWGIRGSLVAAGLLVVLVPLSAQSGESDGAGVVRITDQLPTGIVQVGHEHGEEALEPIPEDGEFVEYDGYCADGLHGGFMGPRRGGWFGGGPGGWWSDQVAMYRARNLHQSWALKRKLGYFSPSGCGGIGCPLIGKYKQVYAVDPHYFDGRDSQLYSAQGYGVPVVVPTAPNVRHQYNYSWGVPSSRLTPLTRVVP